MYDVLFLKCSKGTSYKSTPTVRSWTVLLAVDFFGSRWYSPVFKTTELLKCLSDEGGCNTVCCENYWGRKGLQAERRYAFPNSRLAIKALKSNVMNSKTVYGCSRYLDEIAKNYESISHGYPGTVVLRETAELMNLPGGARPSNFPMNSRIWAFLFHQNQMRGKSCPWKAQLENQPESLINEAMCSTSIDDSSVKLTRNNLLLHPAREWSLKEEVDNSLLFLSESATTAEVVEWEMILFACLPITQYPVSMATVIDMMSWTIPNSWFSSGPGHPNHSKTILEEAH